ncbi:dienelactone hydrolase family protein [Anaerocolumna chitinilytica]|uniref:Hydrolase n=1 Tax=Anaerocolumna chitinilytica TaxID=1727145 RepID=A0A7I8DJC6_9FIRM|nr:dienelactone hydrolase family protein [Anaerocolumna chitinilytica]BCJ98553.1 hydrolase [Anaerocolumna chitinilytica]
MIRKASNKKNAVIILHEIYGINSFIEGICNDYKLQGFDVFCPDMIHRERFLYSEAAQAYQYFLNNKGFEYYKGIEELVSELKLTYDKVFIIGFSVGATIAWRCCEQTNCDGIICCYGSRIREYMSLQPSNPVLLLFAKHDSFEVEIVAEQLGGKPNVDLHILQASHGFMDCYSDRFNKEQTQIAKMYIRHFLNSLL